jgi:hypothetical protein
VLDLVGIVFSGVMIMFVIFRALQLDASRPWFEPPPPPGPAPAAEAVPAKPGRGPVRPVRSRGTSR